jgi:hypothetical protein
MLFISALRPFGALRQICGKFYLFLRQFVCAIIAAMKASLFHDRCTQYPLNMATDFCCSFGMKLVSVETNSKLVCLTKAVQKMTSSYIIKKCDLD